MSPGSRPTGGAASGTRSVPVVAVVGLQQGTGPLDLVLLTGISMVIVGLALLGYYVFRAVVRLEFV